MKRILLVDDDTDMLRLGRSLLTEVGLFVETCDSVVMALDKVRQEPGFDLILCDAKMPRLSGYDLILTLKRDRRYGRIPVAMLSGKKEKEDIRQAIEIGVEDYIIKPISPSDFVKRVTEILERNEKSGSFKLPHIVRLKAPERATATLALEILSLHEKGATLKSPQFLDDGLVLWVGCHFLREIGLHSPQMKVKGSRLATAQGSEESWVVQATFENLKPQEEERLKDWLSDPVKLSKKAA